MKWGPEQDQVILIFILDHCKVQVPYQELSLHLGCTPKALTHRIANLRKAVKDVRENLTANGSGNEDSTPVIPKKRSRTTASKAKATKSNKKAKVEINIDSDGENYHDASEGLDGDDN